MTITNPHPTDDEKALQSLIGQWTKAVREQDYPAIRANHDSNLLMFDVPPPFLSRGLDAYMATWDLFFRHAARPVAFDFTDLEITAGTDVAFATAIGHCGNIERDSTQMSPLDFRLTMGFRKLSGRWVITHEHHSLPATD